MYLPMCFMMCAAWLIVSTSSYKLDNNELQSIFGSPNAPPSLQVIPLTPDSSTPAFIDIDANPEDYYKAPVKNYDSFDWILTKRVSMYTADNFLLSPLGLKLGLAILEEAATGKTKDELAAVLGFDQDEEIVRNKFSNIVNSLKANSSEYILNLGSRVYMDGNTEPQQRYAAIAEKNYQTELRHVNFSNANTAAAEISEWVAKLTKGKIRELVKPEDITNQIMMIINALYFKGTWIHQFNVNDTKLDTFYVTPTVKYETNFMSIQSKFHYVESTFLDSKILRMPFLGKKFSMYIVVPNSLTGLPRVLDNLGNLRGEMFHLDQHVVELRLPKFQFDTSSHLDGVLKELGIKEAFKDSASFPGIARGEQLQQKLKISRVLQKAGIEVNEVGSTAYAATEISLVNKFGQASDTVQEVNANKPFLFFIEDEATRQLLFTGRLVDPTQQVSVFKYAGDV